MRFDIHCAILYCLAQVLTDSHEVHRQMGIGKYIRAAALLLILAAAGCGSGQAPLSSLDVRTGVSDTEIRIGSSLALGGHAGYLGTQMLQGALSYINQINETGGIHGRQIRLIAKDDGYDPTRCLYNTQTLILEDRVFCLFSYVGTPTTVRIIPLVNEARIPLLGMFTGAHRLRDPVNPLLINVRASYYQEIEAAVSLIVNEKGMDRVAVFYQYDEYGFDGLRGAELALKQYGMKPVAKGTYVRGTLDVETGLDRIMGSNAQAVVMIGTYDTCAKFIRLAKEKNYSPLFYNLSFVGSAELARRLGRIGHGVLITQVVPPPEADPRGQALPGIRLYMDHLKRWYPEARPSFVGLEGFLNARILALALERAGRDLDREKFIAAIESIREYDLGIDNAISFGKGDYQGLERVYFTKIHEGKLVLLP